MHLEILRKICRDRLCRSRFFDKVDCVTVYFHFWFYKLLLLMEPFRNVPQSGCSAKAVTIVLLLHFDNDLMQLCPRNN